jgi:predicted amidohydrolase
MSADDVKDSITVAQLRAVPKKGDLQENHLLLMRLLDQIDADVDVVVTPEGFLDGYVSTEESVTENNIADYAIDPDSSHYLAQAKDWAARMDCWLIYGCTRKGHQGGYNSALVVNREGSLHGYYDKIHCQTHDSKYRPGESLSVFEGDFGTFGVMICADRRWPETVRSLAVQGARVIFNPTYGMYDARNLRMMQTRSYESEVFIVFTHPRQALITDPSGQILCFEEGKVDGVCVSRVDLSLADTARSGPSAHLRDRRTDLYRF